MSMFRAVFCGLPLTFLFGTLACSEDQQPLRPTSVDAGMQDRTFDASAGRFDAGENADSGPDAAIGPTACGSSAPELAERNRVDLDGIAFRVAHAVVEGVFGSPETQNGSRVAPLTITNVHYGHTFLVGTEVWISIEGWEIAPSQSYIVAMSGNRLPTFGDQDRPQWWGPIAILPSGDRSLHANVIGYRFEASTSVVVARLESRDESWAYFRALEVLSGQVPEQFALTWSRTFAAPFPEPSDQTYLITLQGGSEAPGGPWVASSVDVRPDGRAARRIAQQAAAQPPPWTPSDFETQTADYQEGWTIHRAAHVMSTEVVGLAGECCSGAGGTFVSHRVDNQLAGAWPHSGLTLGGHAYYPEEGCADRFLVALDAFDGPELTEDRTFACEISDAPAIEFPNPPVARARLMRPDTPDQRTFFEDQLAAPSPLYRLWPSDAVLSAADAADPELGGPWSVSRSVVEAMRMATHPALIEVVEVVERSQWYEVTLTTSFTWDPAPQAPRTVKLAFTCGDARLLVPGSRYIGFFVSDGPIYFDDMEIMPEAIFMVPGVLLEPTPHAQRVSHELGNWFRNQP